MHNLSDEMLCDRWVENPYFQYLLRRSGVPPRGAVRSLVANASWRQRLGEEQIAALLQESLSVAHRTGAIESKDLERVVVDTTVQEKAIAHPTDARLTHRAIEKLVEMGKARVELRQRLSARGQTRGLMVGRYTHAHQFKRARRQLKFLRTRLGRIIRDVRRKIEGDAARQDRFGPLLDLALRVRHQEQRQRGPKVYSWHAPEVHHASRFGDCPSTRRSLSSKPIWN